VPFEPVGPHVFHAAFDFSFMLRRPRTARDHAHPVVPTEVRQLRIDLGVIPVGVQYCRLQVVYIQIS